MSKRKLNLSDLKVSSFITAMDHEFKKNVQGGAKEKEDSVDICYKKSAACDTTVFEKDPGNPAPATAVTGCNYCYTVENGAAC